MKSQYSNRASSTMMAMDPPPSHQHQDGAGAANGQQQQQAEWMFLHNKLQALQDKCEKRSKKGGNAKGGGAKPSRNLSWHGGDNLNNIFSDLRNIAAAKASTNTRRGGKKVLDASSDHSATNKVVIDMAGDVGAFSGKVIRSPKPGSRRTLGSLAGASDEDESTLLTASTGFSSPSTSSSSVSRGSLSPSNSSLGTPEYQVPFDRRVSFSYPLVTKIRTRPYTEEEDIPHLYYSRNEADRYYPEDDDSIARKKRQEGTQYRDDDSVMNLQKMRDDDSVLKKKLKNRRGGKKPKKEDGAKSKWNTLLSKYKIRSKTESTDDDDEKKPPLSKSASFNKKTKAEDAKARSAPSRLVSKKLDRASKKQEREARKEKKQGKPLPIQPSRKSSMEISGAQDSFRIKKSAPFRIQDSFNTKRNKSVPKREAPKRTVSAIL